jgi:anti-anti-sigma factor
MFRTGANAAVWRDDTLFMLSANRTSSSSRAAGSSFLTIQRRGSSVVAAIAGPRLGERESQIIARELHAAITTVRGIRRLVLDLHDVRTMSSLGLGMCIDLRNTAHKRGIETVVSGLCRELADLFRMMKVDRLFSMIEAE